MDDHERSVYLAEIELQARYALRAAMDMARANATGIDDPFYHAHVFLMTSGMVSKLLGPWPTADNYDPSWRGPQLRNLLKVEASSVLSERDLRNAYEHFDRRLDDWRKRSARKNIFDRGGFYPGAIKGLDEIDQLRNIDTSTGDLIFQGHRYSVSKVVKALTDLIDEIEAQRRTRVR